MNIKNNKKIKLQTLPHFEGDIITSTPSAPKYKHLLTFLDHVWSLVLFKKFTKILFILSILRSVVDLLLYI
jgi:hypothetical protein